MILIGICFWICFSLSRQLWRFNIDILELSIEVRIPINTRFPPVAFVFLQRWFSKQKLYQIPTSQSKIWDPFSQEQNWRHSHARRGFRFRGNIMAIGGNITFLMKQILFERAHSKGEMILHQCGCEVWSNWIFLLQGRGCYVWFVSWFNLLIIYIAPLFFFCPFISMCWFKIVWNTFFAVSKRQCVGFVGLRGGSLQENIF